MHLRTRLDRFEAVDEEHRADTLTESSQLEGRFGWDERDFRLDEIDLHSSVLTRR